MFSWFSLTNLQAGVTTLVVYFVSNGVTYLLRQNKSKKIILSCLIQDVEDLAIEHWCSDATDANNRARGIKIQQKIRTVAQKIDKKTERIQSALIEFRQAVTGGNFDSADRLAVPYENEKILLILAMAEKLRESLNIRDCY